MILTEEKKQVADFMKNTEQEKREYQRIIQEDMKLCKEMRELKRKALHVTLKKDKKKLAYYNKLFFRKVEQLTRLRTKQTNPNREEIDRMVNEWKNNHYEF